LLYPNIRCQNQTSEPQRIAYHFDHIASLDLVSNNQIMSSDKSQLILIIVPAIAVAVLLIATSIAITRKLRHRSQSPLLPTREKPAFTQHHLGSLRNGQKPKADPGHLPFLAEPTASHQPQRPVKEAWQHFQDEEKRRRKMNQQEYGQPAGRWDHVPKSAAYWRQVGREMAARRTWWEKVKNKMGL
jgi:hypothetical protein